MAMLFQKEREYDVAHAHIKQAKLFGVNDVYCLGRVMQLQANLWYSQHRLEDAKSEALHALEIYESLGAAGDMQICRELLQAMRNTATKFQAELSGKATSKYAEFLISNSTS